MTDRNEVPEGAEEVSINNWSAVGATVVGKVVNVEPLAGTKVSIMNMEYPDGQTGRVICPTTLMNAIRDNKLTGQWIKALYTGTVKTSGGQHARLFRVWKLKGKPEVGGFVSPLAGSVEVDEDLPF